MERNDHRASEDRVEEELAEVTVDVKVEDTENTDESSGCHDDQSITSSPSADRGVREPEANGQGDNGNKKHEMIECDEASVIKINDETSSAEDENVAIKERVNAELANGSGEEHVCIKDKGDESNSEAKRINKDSNIEEDSKINKDSVNKDSNINKDSNTADNSNIDKDSVNKDSNTEDNSNIDKDSINKDSNIEDNSNIDKDSVNKDSNTEDNSNIDKDSVNKDSNTEDNSNIDKDSVNKDLTTDEDSNANEVLKVNDSKKLDTDEKITADELDEEDEEDEDSKENLQSATNAIKPEPSTELSGETHENHNDASPENAPDPSSATTTATSRGETNPPGVEESNVELKSSESNITALTTDSSLQMTMDTSLDSTPPNTSVSL